MLQIFFLKQKPVKRIKTLETPQTLALLIIEGSLYFNQTFPINKVDFCQLAQVTAELCYGLLNHKMVKKKPVFLLPESGLQNNENKQHKTSDKTKQNKTKQNKTQTELILAVTV